MVRQIRHLTIHTSGPCEEPIIRTFHQLSPRFSERVEYLCRHAYNLKAVDIYVWLPESYLGSNERTFTVLQTLSSMTELASTPDLHIYVPSTSYPVVQMALDVLLSVKDRLKVSSISITPNFIFKSLEFFPQFPHLRKVYLNCQGLVEFIDSTTDLNDVFKNTPLTELSLDNFKDIKSFPRTLRRLRFNTHRWGDYELSYFTWKAVCDLHELEGLEMACFLSHTIDWPPLEFKSSQVRGIWLTIQSERGMLPSVKRLLNEQILEPVLLFNRHLEVIHLDISTGLSEKRIKQYPLAQQVP